ncbi:MAG: MBL fold metallo-hydrolase [Deltaproteobacteria bacterium]|nr:MBL fold metallo-hydrolase [Deltaproteobacteria bacterium]
MTENGKSSHEWETKHPGWLPLSGLLGAEVPFFEKILLLPGFEFSSNIYVVAGNGLSIVDPGNDYTAFVDLFARGHGPADIKKVVITHGHRDHAMGVFELLRSYPGIIEGGGLDLILHEAGPAELKEVAKRAGVRVTEVRGGEAIGIGGHEWEVIHTPGHTMDGICLYHPPSKTVFTGDTVLPHAMAEPDENAGGRLDHYLYGLRTLLGKDVENVLPGHGLPVASVGKKVIEETYEGVMMKIIGVEAGRKTPWIDGATALAQKGLLEEAAFCCEKELASNPENPRALQLKASCLNDLGRFHEALGTLDKLEELHSQGKADPFELIARGYALMGLGRYHESVRFFDEVLKIRPGVKDALIYKGMALYLAGDYDEAMEIEHFRTEFMGRFREELLKKKKSSGSSDIGAPGDRSG